MTSGEPTRFDGALSLMLLAPTDGGDQRSLARWDFRPTTCKRPIDRSDQRGNDSVSPRAAGRYADRGSTRIVGATCCRDDGDKLLAHAHDRSAAAGRVLVAHGCARVGRSSRESSADEPTSKPVDGRRRQRRRRRARRVGLFDGGWTIARPGQPANLPKADQRCDSDWRASLEPPPTGDGQQLRQPGRSRASSRPRESIEDVARSAGSASQQAAGLVARSAGNSTLERVAGERRSRRRDRAGRRRVDA